MSGAVVPAFVGGLFQTMMRARDAAPLAEWPAPLLRTAAAECRALADELRAINAEAAAALRNGIERRDLLARYGGLFDSLGPGLSEDARTPPGSEGLFPEFAAAWADFLGAVAETHATLAPFVAKARSPMPPIDRERLEEGAAALERGDFVTLRAREDFIRAMNADV